jgi:hypothetical protein
MICVVQGGDIPRGHSLLLCGGDHSRPGALAQTGGEYLNEFVYCICVHKAQLCSWKGFLHNCRPVQPVKNPVFGYLNQGCGSGAVLGPDSIRSLVSDPGGQKLPTESRKKLRSFMFFEVLNVLFWELKASFVT